MRRTAYAVVVAIAILGVSQASAGVSSGDHENDYEGVFEETNGYYFGFDLNDAKTKVKGITARVGYACDNDDLVITTVEADGTLTLNDAGRFSGKVKRVESPNSSVKYRVKGSLTKGGKAKGALKGTYEDPFYDTLCRTGRLTWHAKRGADVEPR